VNEIPLFPLSSVLFPGGRMSLRIFEQRYLDLVRRCARDDSGFGLVWITEGIEVAHPGATMPQLAELGVYARIVDWDSLPNGLLGITIEGGDQFYLDSARAEDNRLVIGRVRMLDALPPEPLREEWVSLVEVLTNLEAHPHVRRLGVEADRSNAWGVGYTLAQLLPVDEHVKYQLLALEDIDDFMEELDGILGELGGLTA